MPNGSAPPPDLLAASTTLVRALRAQLSADGTVAELIETHISWVLLAGDTAWKIKKPVSLGFLDFSTLESRRHFCHEEWRLNRRHAPSVYVGVVAITGTPSSPRWGGPGPAIDYAIQMRRFPPRSLLSERLADGTLQPAHLDMLAAHLAALHEDAPVAPPDQAWGRPEEVRQEALDVLQRLEAHGVEVADLRRWLDPQLPRLMALWNQRRATGRVRECHGDLHLRNAVVLGAGVEAFDGIEFDPALRWIDVCSDMAFMGMDLLAHGRAALAWRFVNAWLDASGDRASVAVLRFYLAYRALVRALVGRLGPAAVPPEPSADGYLALSRWLALARPRPRLLVTHGLSGSGKTWLTQGLLERTGALRLRADVERKRLFGLAPLEASADRVPGGIYGPQANERTYARLGELARVALAEGWPVIIDAACLRRHERARLRALAADMGVPFTLLDCRAGVETLHRRLQARQLEGRDASEADASVLARQIGFDESLGPDEIDQAMVVDTEAVPDLPALAERWLQAGT